MAIGGLLVLALTAALVVPHFIDWTNYRADFEREASRILGRDVEVRGSASARLLPFPSVSFTDVVVTDASGETVMTVDTFSMDAELAPFLSGEVLIFDMRIERPEAVLTVGSDGMLDWTARSSLPGQTRQVTLENITVIDGRVRVRHLAGDREHVLSGIDATVSARSLAGPWRGDGELEVDGVRTALTVSTGTADPNGSLRVRLRAEPHDYPMNVELEGQATIKESGAISYDGRFRLSAHATGNATLEEGEAPRAPDYRLDGDFHLDHERFVAEDVRFETGPVEDPYTAEGSAMIALGAEPRFFVRAEGVQVRLEEAEGGAASLEDRIEALRGFAARLPRPNMPGRINIDLPAIVAGDTTIREVRFSAEPSERGWRFASLTANLPGRTTLEASGELTVGSELGFDGELLLAVNQPSGFASWLSRDVDDAIRRLPAAGFRADVELSERRQVFQDLELALGASVFRGAVENLQPEGERPSMALNLRGDALDVEGLAAFAALFVSDTAGNRWQDHDLDFDLAADMVRLAGVTAEGVEASLKLRDGELAIEQLNIGALAGASIEARGTLANLPVSPDGFVETTVEADDLAPLVELLAQRWSDNRLIRELALRADRHPGLLEGSRIDMALRLRNGTGGPAELELNADGRAGGSAIVLEAVSRDWRGDMVSSPLSASLEIEAEQLPDLFGLLGLPGLPLGSADGARADLSLSGRLDDGAELTLTLGDAETSARYQGTVSLTNDRFATSGSMRLASEDIAPWLMTAAVSLPGMELGLPLGLSGELDYRDGLLVITDLEGEVAGAALRGDLNAALRDGMPHLSGEVLLAALDMALPIEMVLGSAAVEANASPWPEGAFRSTVSAPFTADLSLAVDDLFLGDGLSLERARMSARLANDGISISEFSAQAFGGGLSGLADLRNDGGTGLLSAQLRLSQVDAEQILPTTGLAGQVDLSASVTTTGKTVGAMFAALSGSGTARVEGLVIANLASDAFEPILEAADRIGRDVEEMGAVSFAADIAQAGSFAGGEAEFPFTLAAGELRTPPVQLSAPEARLTVEPRFDFGEMAASVEATIHYDAGAEALVGSDPAIRFAVRGSLGDLTYRVDTEPLTQYLTQRALEIEQQRVEAMQATLLEQQRIRREVRYFDALRQERLDRAEEQRLAEEEALRMVEDEIRRRAEAEERRRAEEEQRRIEEEARRAAEEEARRQAQEAARIRAEQERQRVEEQRRQAEERARRHREARIEEDERRQEEHRRLIDVQTIMREADAAGRELEAERTAEAARAEAERRQQLESDIESILEFDRDSRTDPDAVDRTPLAPPPSAAPAPGGDASSRRTEGAEQGFSGLFRPENLDGFSEFSRER